MTPEEATSLLALKSRAERLWWEYNFLMDQFMAAPMFSGIRLHNLAAATMVLARYFIVVEQILEHVNQDNTVLRITK